MVDFRRDPVGWLIGAIGGTGAIVLGILEQYEFLGAILATTIGAGIAYFVQNRTQNRTWKREYSLKNTETIYGPLFEMVDRTLQYQNGSFPEGVGVYQWDELRRTYQYLTVDEKFKKKLDSFYEKTIDYNKKLQEARRIAHELTVEETRVLFPSYSGVSPQFVIKTNKGPDRQIHISSSLIRKEHPQKMASKEADHELHQYFVQFTAIKGGQNIPPQKYEGDMKNKFDELLNSCSQEFENEPSVKEVRKVYPEIIKELREIKRELIRRIQEPWDI